MDQLSNHIGEQAALEALRNRASNSSAAPVSADCAGGPELTDAPSEAAFPENSSISAIAASAPATLADPASIVAAMHESATDDHHFAGETDADQPSIFALLVRALRDQRIVIIRGQAGISYAALLALLGSLLVNGAILTFLIFLGVWAFISQASNFKYAVTGETGGSGTNGPILVESAGVSIPANSASFSKSLNVPRENPTVLPTHNQTDDLVALAIAPEPTAAPTAPPPKNPLLENAVPDNIIGFSAGDAFTAPKVHLPPHVADIRTDHVIPAAPAPPAQSHATVASANNLGGQGHGAVDSSGDDGPDDPTDVFPLAKPGMGNGQGTDTGNGWDPSGANNPNPRVLSMNAIDLPLEVALSGKSGRAAFQVTVNPDGRAGEIKVLQSSGFESLDAVCRTAIRNAKFKPAYIAGRPVAASMVVGFPFGDEH